MIRAGLTGGLASGKSVVGNIFAGLGCHVVRADELGHAVLAPDGEVYISVVEFFGSGILKTDGTIDRKRLAADVFASPERLEKLNSLVHPAVIRREEALLEDAAIRDPGGIGIVEAAILVETGSYRRFDRLILAVCTEEQQVERAMHRDHSSREQVLARLRRQLPLEAKKAYADFIIDTSGTEEQTAEQARVVYQALRSLTK